MLSTLISLVVLVLGLMLCHKWNPLLGSLVCSVLAYYGIKRLLQRKLESIIEKFSKASAAKCRLPQDSFILPETAAQLLSRLPGRRSEPSGPDVGGVSTCLGLLPQAGEADGHLPSDYVSAELKAFVDNIMSRYIESWYSAVSNNQDFPRALEYIIEDLLRVLRERLASLDACEVLEHMVPVVHAHYRKYRECLLVVERTKLNSCDESCDLLRREAIKKRFLLQHVAFESDASERSYLRGVTTVLVQLLEPPHLLASPATKALVIDILTNNVLVPTIDRLCEPEWIGWAVLYLLSMEEDAEVLGMKKSAEEQSAEKGSGTGACPCKDESNGAATAEEFGGGDPPATQGDVASLASLSRVPSVYSVNSSGECIGLPDVYVGTQESSVRVFAGRFGEGAVEEAVEAEVFLGSLVFMDINIERTESRSVPGKGVHTVYCIKYAVCKHNEDRAAPTVEDREVWRRFREFLELQGSLESNRKLRKHLVGIEGPSRGLATVLSDKRNVTKRRKFLNKYLKALCSREAIVNSREFHKFLDYDDDDAEKLPEQQLVPEMRRQASSTRLDRVAQGVRTKLGLLKSALPGDDHSSLSPLSPLEGSQILMSEYLPGDMDYSFAKDSRSDELGQCIFNFIDNFDQASSPEFSPPHSPGSLPPPPQLLPLDRSPSNLSQKSSQGAPSTPEVHFPPMENDVVPLWRGNAPKTPVERLAESLHSDIPLCASAVDFVVDSLEDGHFCKSAQLVLFVQLLLGRPLERVLKEQLDAVFGETNCALYLHRLHERLWGAESVVETFTEAQVARGLAKAVPVWAQLVFGVDTVCEVARTLAKATQIRDLNRCLVYELMDILIDCLLAQDNCDARFDDDA